MVFSDQEVKVLKSVHCLLALDFLHDRLAIDDTVLVFRHPASIIASHMRMDNKDIWRPILQKDELLDSALADFKSDLRQLDDKLAKAGARIGAIYYLWQQYKEKNHYHFVKYESMCLNRLTKFKELYQNLTLDWNDDVQDYIHQLNQEGEGYSVNRIADQQINKWRKELSPSQASAIQRGYQIFSTELQYKF